MAYTIVRKYDADEFAIERTELPPSVATQTAAITALTTMLDAYPVHGEDPEQRQWWARDKDGKQWTFWIDG